MLKTVAGIGVSGRLAAALGAQIPPLESLYVFVVKEPEGIVGKTIYNHTISLNIKMCLYIIIINYLIYI